jgi:hypothetical protein
LAINFAQANQFYLQINDQLLKLQQQVTEMKVVRDMARASAGAAPQQPPKGMMPPPGMPMGYGYQMPPMGYGYQMPPMQPMQPGAPQMPYGQAPLGQSFHAANYMYGQPHYPHQYY